jgi:hypothetical protein
LHRQDASGWALLMLQKAGIPEVNGFSADIFLSSLGGRLDIVEANIRGTLRIQVLQRRPKKTIGFVR